MRAIPAYQSEYFVAQMEFIEAEGFINEKLRTKMSLIQYNRILFLH